MKRFITIAIVLLMLGNAQAQTTITLEECYAKAAENYPLIKQYELISQTERYTLSNIGKAYLPQFTLNGQATYQSTVTRVPIDLSALPGGLNIASPNRDQYKATIDVNQTIWDGGTVKSERKIATLSSSVERQQVEVNMYAVKDRINQLYFGILAIDEQLALLYLLEQDLQANEKVAKSMFANGTATQSDLDQLAVELLNIEQQRTEQQYTKQAYIKMLSLFVHQPLTADAILTKPSAGSIQYGAIDRPEQQYYDLQRSLLNARNDAIAARNMPRFGLFAQGGYGRPGLNMLENKFEPFGIGGVKLTWNFGDFYTKKNEKRIIEHQRNAIDVQQDVFLFNTTLQLTQEQQEIQKMEQLLAKDNEIITLRNSVKTKSESKYRNGVYQINDLIRDINAESQARQTKALREIQHLMSIYNYKHTQGH